MPRERGLTRAIAQALLDGPDFGQLPDLDKLVLVWLKVGAPPSGIQAAALEECASRLVSQGVGRAYEGPSTDPKASGKRMNNKRDPYVSVLDSLKRLQTNGWIASEGRILWIVRQLEFEPTHDVRDRKHRSAIQAQVAGLPHVPVVVSFVKRYAAWFPATDAIPSGCLWALQEAGLNTHRPSDGPSQAHTRPSEGPSMAHRSKETETETETDLPARATQPRSVDRSRDLNSNGTTAQPASPNAASAAQLAGWATSAVASRWGTAARTYAADAMAASIAAELDAFPRDLVQRSIYGQAQGSTLAEPPKSLRWFVPGIRRDARDVHASPPRGRPAEGAPRRAPTRVGDVAAVVPQLIASCPYCGERVSWEGWQPHHQSRHVHEDLPSFTQLARAEANANAQG